MIVHGEVFTIPRSCLRAVKNHLQELVSSVSTTAIATGNIQSLGSIPIAVKRTPPNFVLR
jgi:hypothetical protein